MEVLGVTATIQKSKRTLALDKVGISCMYALHNTTMPMWTLVIWFLR